FDFLPLEGPAGQDLPLPTSPAAPIPTFDLEGNEPLPELGSGNGQRGGAQRTSGQGPAASRPPARPERSRSAGEIWLEGSSILCACPDCRAPMTIRVWLMIADCWRCGTSIELSEEQEREVQRLLAESREGEKSRE